MRKLIGFMLVFCLAFIGAGHADDATPLLYTRTAIAIVRKAPPPGPSLPWRKELSAPANPAITFDVEIRDAMTLYNQDGWYNLSGENEDSGVLLVFSAPGIAPVIPSTQYAPLDILMIDKEGTIIQIAPNIRLSSLDEEITPPSPILAFLFLKGGTCEKHSIRPGDTVQYKIFKKPPMILSAPPPVPGGASPNPTLSLPPQAKPAASPKPSLGSHAPLLIQPDSN